MGTWGKGLYDNDSALDSLGELVRPGDGPADAATLAAQIGLLAWFNPVSLTGDDDDVLGGRVRAVDLTALPAATREALVALLDDPEGATGKGSRSRAVSAVLGGYCDGPRIDALVSFPGAEAVVGALAGRAAARLDRALSVQTSLHEVTGAMASLGVLLELSQAGLWQPAPDRVVRWREGFAVIDRATKEERGFWGSYVRRVRAGFDLLAPGTKPPPRTAAAKSPPAWMMGDRKPAEVVPPERYSHPKLGMGVLVGRSGTGLDAVLELRFEGGIKRRFPVWMLTRAKGG